jgi:pseudouridine-5'-monophosphatase
VTNQPKPAIRQVIYDMDGLLLDTEIFYTQVTQQIVGRYGKVFDWSLKSQMIGRPAIESARQLVKVLELPLRPEEYLEERELLLEKHFPQAEAKPGAERLARHLHQHGVPQAVATSSSRPFFELKTSRHRAWFDLFDCVVTGDDPLVNRGKPQPDIFLAAAERLGGQPAQCLVFEDAPAGLQAALAAGMPVVVVPDPNMDKQRYVGSNEILDSLADFEPESWQLPGFPR